MPNHVINEVVFAGVDADARSRILAVACNADGLIDFDVLVPTPANIWQGSVGSAHAVFMANALDWARQNWGTKWNAYGQEEEGYERVEQTADGLTLRFQTAWSPPYPWLAALLNTLKLPFAHNWLDEGREDASAGAFKIDGKWGPDWTEKIADEPLKRHLHKLLYGVEQFNDEDQPA